MGTLQSNPLVISSSITLKLATCHRRFSCVAHVLFSDFGLYRFQNVLSYLVRRKSWNRSARTVSLDRTRRRLVVDSILMKIVRHEARNNDAHANVIPG